MIALDEAQMLGRDDLRRLLAGVHRCGQDALPLACVRAGLPDLVGDVAKAASYAERMFTVADLGALTPDQVGRAVADPAAPMGVSWAPDAIETIVDRSDGFPFFVQTWVFHIWNVAVDDPVSAADVDRAGPPARLEPCVIASWVRGSSTRRATAGSSSPFPTSTAMSLAATG